MGAGGKEVTLDTFESHLKKLLHIIDKLPKIEREKAVLILRNSANHYSNLTSGHPPPPPPPCPQILFNNLLPCNQALSEIPVSQVAKTFDLLKDEGLGKPCDLLEPQLKTESQAILDEIGGLTDHEAGTQGGFIEDGDDWDQHILELQESDIDTSPASPPSCIAAAPQDSFTSAAPPPSCIPSNAPPPSCIPAAPQTSFTSAAPPLSCIPTDASPPSCIPAAPQTSFTSAAPPPSCIPSTAPQISNILAVAPHTSCISAPPRTSFTSAAPLTSLINAPLTSCLSAPAASGEPIEFMDQCDFEPRLQPGHLPLQPCEHPPLNNLKSRPRIQPQGELEALGSKLEAAWIVKPEPNCKVQDGTQTALEMETTGKIPSTAMPQCKLCLKRLGVTGVLHPMSCRCRTELCGSSCFSLHINQSNCSQSKKDGKGKKKREYRCGQCDKYFLTSLTLKTHMEGHAKNDCDKCPAKCATRRLLVAHMKQAHFINIAEKYYKCKFCTRKFSKKPSLWFHYTSHTVGTQAVCLKCGEIVQTKELLVKHQNEHKETQLTCHRCGEFFARRQQYSAHMKQHDNYSCSLCSKSFSSKKRLKFHKNKEHGEGAKPSGDVCKAGIKEEPTKAKNWKKSFRCGFCSFENTNYKKIVRHERKHKNFRKFVCELCGNAFNSEHNLKEHTTYVHMDERNFKCEKCDKSFKARNALIRHEQVHNESRLFLCPCGKSYKRQSHLNRHFSATSHGYSGGGTDNPENLVAKIELQENLPNQTWIQDQNNLDKQVSENRRQEQSCKAELKTTASLSQDISASADIANASSHKPEIKDYRKIIYKENPEDYEKLWHYKIPKKFATPQKYPYYSDKPSRPIFFDINPESSRGELSRSSHSQPLNKYPNSLSLRNQGSSQHQVQRHFQPEYLDRGSVGAERHSAVLQEKYHNDHHTKTVQDMDREFLDRYPCNHDKVDYSSQLSEKPYTDFSQDKNYLIPDVLGDRQTSHCDNKNYILPDVMEERQSGSQDKHLLPLDDRLFHSNVRDSNYNPCLDSRMLGGVQDFRQISNLPDAGPADLTITPKDGTRNDVRSGDYLAGLHSSMTRHSFNKPRALSPVGSSSRSYTDSSRTHYMSPRTQHDLYRSTDLFRPPYSDSRSTSTNPAVEGLEDSTYRPLQDLGYPRQQNPYFDQIDPYVLLSRSAELEDGYEKRHKYYRPEKYVRQEELSLRQDGGLLPPLLALTASLPHSSATSPTNIKMDYMCSPNDNISSHYNMSDGNLDYY